ncbi:MAG: hypothetical protein EYC70_00660 [Planctomycetota bacterium]|nr:MAG: hypothetical protein EYC70_00660 [Planctomycetota bacterium]
MKTNRPFLTLAAAGGLTALMTSPAGAFLLYSSGPINDRASNPPSYANCTSCHTTNPVNSGDGGVAISGVPAEYTPGATYPITVMLQDPNQRRWGFEIAVFGPNDNNIGTTTITNANLTQKSTVGGRSWIKHTTAGTFAGTVNGPVSWSFDWTAPAAPGGIAFFYVSGNAANNNGFNTGDFIYNSSTAAAPAGAAHADSTLILQPDSISFRRGRSVTVRARVRNHTSSAQSYDLVSRVRLPGGSFFPPAGSLLPPIGLSLAAEGFTQASMTHMIPSGAPLITATYEAFIQDAGGNPVDMDNFTFSVTP